MHDTLQIKVIYCPADKAPLTRQIQVKKGCTAGQAIQQFLLLTKLGEHLEKDLRIGIFGKQCQPDTALHDLDRVEIYRPLLLSPTEARRLRAQTLAKK